jgi:uncharacterized repeat protein (TIGR03803 family)
MRPSTSACLSLVFLFPFSSIAPISAQPHGRVLYPLPAWPACGQPLAPLVSDNRGNLYGTGFLGGAANDGCVYELAPIEGEWKENVLYTFSGSDGSLPRAPLTLDKSGNLYGTASGGTYGGGVVFELSPSSLGAWTESVLYNFGSWKGDGWGPEGKLAFDGQGNIYGTTGGGGAYDNAGTVFELSPSGSGWIETILYSFDCGVEGPGGDSPVGGLVTDREGQLYGVTRFGGEYGDGAGLRACFRRRNLQGENYLQLLRRC